jgi:tRNA-dihydrouridine synthase B
VVELYDFYGEHTGLRIARKHISWYTKGLAGSAHFRHQMNQLESVAEQHAAVDEFFAEQAARGLQLRYLDNVSLEGLAA